jgi:hypothetical protein
LRLAWGKIKYSLAVPVTAEPYQHPRLAKSKVGFATYADHLRVVEAWNAADARRTAREKKLKEEGEYLRKSNERLRLVVVPKGRERLKQNMQYSPSRDPMFNGQDKAAGVKHALELSEVPALATNIYQYDAWIAIFWGHIVQHLASAAGGRQSYVIIYVVTFLSLALCLFHCTRFIQVVGRVLGFEFVLGLLVSLPLGLRHVATACDMHSSISHSSLLSHAVHVSSAALSTCLNCVDCKIAQRSCG